MEQSMASEPVVITNPKFRMWLRPDGIVQLVWVPRCDIAYDDAVASIDAMTSLTGGNRAPLLVDVRGTGSQDRKARTEFVRRGDLVSAVGLIVDTPLSRIMANFYLAVSRPIMQTRLFDDDDPAVAWLLEVAS
jgi:hypothetical protein